MKEQLERTAKALLARVELEADNLNVTGEDLAAVAEAAVRLVEAAAALEKEGLA